MATIKDIYLAEKSIGGKFTGWSKPEEETDYIWFDSPIEIGGVTETGLVLHGGCIANRPDCHVSFELRISRTPGRHYIPIERVDWRSLEGGHSNPRHPKSEWSARRVSDTHLHDFWLNWSEEVQRMRGGRLSVARELDEPVNSFEELRSLVGKRLQINNIEIVSEPSWEYDFFSGGMF